MNDQPLFELALRLGDNDLVLAQRLSEWVGHAPVLEEDIGIANIALDLLGQSRLWLELAGQIEGKGRSADDLAYHRDCAGFRNLLLVEQPNGDFAQTLMRSFLFDAWHKPLLAHLAGLNRENDPWHRSLAEIAEKASKEVAYHVTRSASLVVALGDGNEESHQRMQKALDLLWPYAGEMLDADSIDKSLIEDGILPPLDQLRMAWEEEVLAHLREGQLKVPEDGFVQKGGKSGVHSEHLGYLLAEMQFLQRAYPGAQW